MARNEVQMPAQTHLPVQNGGLPLCDLVDVLQPPLPLVDLLSDVPHYRQRRRHVSIVAADTKRTQLVPEASGRDSELQETLPLLRGTVTSCNITASGPGRAEPSESKQSGAVLILISHFVCARLTPLAELSWIYPSLAFASSGAACERVRAAPRVCETESGPVSGRSSAASRRCDLAGGAGACPSLLPSFPSFPRRLPPPSLSG